MNVAEMLSVLRYEGRTGIRLIAELFRPPYAIEPLEADLFLSVGHRCRTAYYLKKYRLRSFSCPLDWMMDYDLRTVVDLFRDGFAGFFADYEERFDDWGDCRHVVDTRTKMVSLHAFSKELPMPEAHAAFRETMARRYRRMDEGMRRAEHIVFVCNRTDPREDFAYFLASMGELYSARLTCLNIREDATKRKLTENYSDRLRLIEYCFNDVFIEGIGVDDNRFVWRGDKHEWAAILKRCVLRGIPAATAPWE